MNHLFIHKNCVRIRIGELSHTHTHATNRCVHDVVATTVWRPPTCAQQTTHVGWRLNPILAECRTRSGMPQTRHNHIYIHSLHSHTRRKTSHIHIKRRVAGASGHTPQDDATTRSIEPQHKFTAATTTTTRTRTLIT